VTLVNLGHTNLEPIYARFAKGFWTHQVRVECGFSFGRGPCVGATTPIIQGYYISESSDYRILKAIGSPSLSMKAFLIWLSTMQSIERSTRLLFLNAFANLIPFALARLYSNAVEAPLGGHDP